MNTGIGGGMNIGLGGEFKNFYSTSTGNNLNVNLNNLNPNLSNSNSAFKENNNLNNINLNSPNVNVNTNLNNNNYGLTSEMSQSKGINANNYLQGSALGSSTNSGLILPETNFCNYQPSGKVGNTVDKYMNLNSGSSNDLKPGAGSSLLEHKYGNNLILSSSQQRLGNDQGLAGSMGSNGSSGFGMSQQRRTYNIEEEYPRELAQPQYPVLKKEK